MSAEGTLGSRIKNRRNELGISQDKLAEDMFIPKTTLSTYENDKVDIKGSVLLELSRHLYTNPCHLLGFESDFSDDMADAVAVMFHKIKDEKAKKLAYEYVKMASLLYS